MCERFDLTPFLFLTLNIVLTFPLYVIKMITICYVLNEKDVVSSCLHIFVIRYLCFLRKRSGALGRQTILRRPRAIYLYLNVLFDVRKLVQPGRDLKCNSPSKKT